MRPLLAGQEPSTRSLRPGIPPRLTLQKRSSTGNQRGSWESEAANPTVGANRRRPEPPSIGESGRSALAVISTSAPTRTTPFVGRPSVWPGSRFSCFPLSRITGGPVTDSTEAHGRRPSILAFVKPCIPLRKVISSTSRGLETRNTRGREGPAVFDFVNEHQIVGGRRHGDVEHRIAALQVRSRCHLAAKCRAGGRAHAQDPSHRRTRCT